MSSLKDAFAINIEPCLPSAGIAGLAHRFGSANAGERCDQRFFYPGEKPVEVGDYLRTAGVSGTVEEISMRSTILRDSDGTLHGCSPTAPSRL